MRRSWKSKLGPAAIAGVAIAGVAFTTAAAGQAAPAGQRRASDNACSLATNAEFQQAHGVHPQIGIIPDDPTPTDVVWGSHCDYAGGAIDLFQTKTPAAELERVLGIMKAAKTPRAPVPGLGQRAFFTVIYPDDEYARRGFLAVYAGPRIVTFSMDPFGKEPVEATRPRLERFAKLVLPRVK
jgi:hypothetical protein